MRIAILDDYQGVALEAADWSPLVARGQVEVFTDHLDDESALSERLRDFGAVILMRERTPFPRSLIAALPNLRLIVTTGRRNASIDVEAASEAGVTVCGTNGLDYPTAELTWGLILALARRIPQEHAAIRAGQWQTDLGEGLKGKTLGVIGLGRLGGQVATVGRAFGMEVLAWSQNLTAERCAEVGVQQAATKEELLRSADVVTIHLVLSDRSRGLIGGAELRQMKPSAYLVNTSRGPIVEEAAMLQALQDGTIAGAGLDVFDHEPLPADHPLRHMDRVVLTPHVGYVTRENYAIFYGEAVEAVLAFMDGSPVRVVPPRR